ncbi:transposase-like protein [Niabella hirudinis]
MRQRYSCFGKIIRKWGHKYRHAIESWRNNRDCLTNYFDFPLKIRKIIYTTNTIENLNRGIRNTQKQKCSSPMIRPP